MSPIEIYISMGDFHFFLMIARPNLRNDPTLLVELSNPTFRSPLKARVERLFMIVIVFIDLFPPEKALKPESLG